jgi:hypothetical protein
MIKLRPFLKALGLNIAAWIAFLVLVLSLYFVWLRDYQMNWGATEAEVERYMAGDELEDNPEFNSTRAVEINATPEQIWPWIVQIGYGRAGFYGFDRLDNGGMPSAERILPEWQDLKAGDSIPCTEYEGEPIHFLEVIEMEPNKSMLWLFIATPWKGGTWSWGLYPVDDNRTRLVSRLRKGYEIQSIQDAIAIGVIDVSEILMMRTTLLGIKRRAEAM